MIQEISFKKVLFLLFTIPFLFLQNSSAQDSSENNSPAQFLSGNIVDAKTNKPIKFAEVFISGTTSGCITDTLGNFNLKIPFFPCTLIADHVAYESFITPLKTNKEHLAIKLKPYIRLIEEVSVASKNLRKKNQRFFNTYFIQGNKKYIEVLNDSILTFNRNEMEFTASSHDPLIIINKFLGYKMRLVLDEFIVFYVDRPKGSRIPLNSFDRAEVVELTGHYYFEPLQSTSIQEQNFYEDNRRRAYFGSHRHFLKAIYNNEMWSQGYSIRNFPKEQKKSFVENKRVLPFADCKEFVIQADSLLVEYYYDSDGFPINIDDFENQTIKRNQKSKIYPTKEPFLLYEFGISPNLSFTTDGLKVFKSFTNSLPKDYDPEKITF
jgi:hypothetical protein